MTGFKQRASIVLMAVVAMMVTGAASAQSTLRCESADGHRRDCRFDGAGTVQLTTQISRELCVQNQSWGVNGNTIWVDRGCRADFTIVRNDGRSHEGWKMRNGGQRPQHNRTITVVCESKNGRRNRCAADTLGQITMERQLTRSARCVEGRTWGYDSSAIWVDRGCRAEFLIADNSGTYRERGPSQAMRTVVCESNSTARNHCNGDSQFGVQIAREISRNRCIMNQTWGADRTGVWVSDGCSAEFSMKTRL